MGNIWGVKVDARSHAINADEVRRALALLVDPDACHELRGLPSGRSRLVRGNNLDAAVRAVEELSDDKGVYITLNPVRDDLGDKAASDKDVAKRRHLLIDIDRSARAKALAGSPDTNASETEKEAAKRVADQILDDLTALGWPRPVMLDSGNGWHLVYAIDLPNDAATKKLIRRCLQAIKAAYDDDDVEIDAAVYNASRISKLPGTWARKGPHSDDRPHRMALMVSVPTAYAAVPTEHLGHLAALADDPEPAPAPSTPWILPVYQASQSREGYAREALRRECVEMAACPAGNRNHRLNLAAFRIGQLLHLGLGRDEAERTLLSAAHAAGLGQLESVRTVKSGLKGGESHPRFPQNYPDSSSQGTDGAIVPIIPFIPPPSISEEPEPWEPPVIEQAHAVDPFPIHILPESLVDLCRSGAEAIGCPVDYLATAAIGLAGGVIGRTVALKMTTTWEVTPNLFVAIVGPPGSKKSPALKLMAGPLYAIDRRLRDQYKQDKQRYKELTDKDKAEEPTLYHLTLDDTTREAFGKILNDNPRGLVLIKDELTAWVADLNAYRGGKGSDRQFWMSLNTGALVKVTRKGSPEPLVIVHPCGGVVGCLTPSTLPQVRDSPHDDGWFDRILFTFPDAVERPTDWLRREVPRDLIDDWSRAVDRLWARTMVRDDEARHPRPYWIHLTDAAERQWAEFYAAHHREQREHDFPRGLIGPWSKFEGFTLRLAVILSQLHQAYDLDVELRPNDVDGIHMRGAALLIAYFKSHFRRVRVELGGAFAVLDDDALAVLDWLRDSQIEAFTKHDLTRKFRSFDESDRRNALNALVACKAVRFAGKARAGDRPGRARECYEVNPAIHEAL